MLDAGDRPPLDLDRWQRIARVAARADVAWGRWRDRRGRAVDASAGDPFAAMLRDHAEQVAERHGLARSDYRGHDGTATDDVGDPSP